MIETDGRKLMLNVGCGPKQATPMGHWFLPATWREIRLDIDPSLEPDIVASISDLRGAVDDESMDCVYSAHSVEHLFPHEVSGALMEFGRVLKPTGFAIVRVPDLQRAAALVAADLADEPAYISPAGPIAPLDMLYGFRQAIAAGQTYMAHKTGFTAKTMQRALESTVFPHVIVQRVEWELIGVASKSELGVAAFNEMIAAAAQPAAPGSAQTAMA